MSEIGLGIAGSDYRVVYIFTAIFVFLFLVAYTIYGTLRKRIVHQIHRLKKAREHADMLRDLLTKTHENALRLNKVSAEMLAEEDRLAEERHQANDGILEGQI